MRVLFDQAAPVPIRRFLKDHFVRTAAQEGWDLLQNGDLLDAAEAAGFDVLLTTDKNIRYQQNLAGRKIAILVLMKQQWPELRPHVHFVVAAIDAAVPGWARASSGREHILRALEETSRNVSGAARALGLTRSKN
jgi:transcriptional regulator with GAF, ATPase, and Fis domain